MARKYKDQFEEWIGNYSTFTATSEDISTIRILKRDYGQIDCSAGSVEEASEIANKAIFDMLYSK